MKKYGKLAPSSKGAIRSAAAIMASLDYDPVVALIDVFNESADEVELHKGVRDGTIVQLNPKTGKERHYSAMSHNQSLDRMANISKELLRYAHARVEENKPEVSDESKGFQLMLADGTVIDD